MSSLTAKTTVVLALGGDGGGGDVSDSTGVGSFGIEDFGAGGLWTN